VTRCDPLTTRAIPERFCDELPHKEVLYKVSSSFILILDLGLKFGLKLVVRVES